MRKIIAFSFFAMVCLMWSCADGLFNQNESSENIETRERTNSLYAIGEKMAAFYSTDTKKVYYVFYDEKPTIELNQRFNVRETENGLYLNDEKRSYNFSMYPKGDEIDIGGVGVTNEISPFLRNASENRTLLDTDIDIVLPTIDDPDFISCGCTHSHKKPCTAGGVGASECSVTNSSGESCSAKCRTGQGHACCNL